MRHVYTNRPLTMHVTGINTRLLKGKIDAASTGSMSALLEIIRTSEHVCEEFCARTVAFPSDRLVRAFALDNRRLIHIVNFFMISRLRLEIN